MWEVTHHEDDAREIVTAIMGQHSSWRDALRQARAIVLVEHGLPGVVVSCESEDGHTGCSWSSDLRQWAWYTNASQAACAWTTYLRKERQIIAKARLSSSETTTTPPAPPRL